MPPRRCRRRQQREKKNYSSSSSSTARPCLLLTISWGASWNMSDQRELSLDPSELVEPTPLLPPPRLLLSLPDGPTPSRVLGGRSTSPAAVASAAAAGFGVHIASICDPLRMRSLMGCRRWGSRGRAEQWAGSLSGEENELGEGKGKGGGGGGSVSEELLRVRSSTTAATFFFSSSLLPSSMPTPPRGTKEKKKLFSPRLCLFSPRSPRLFHL